MTCVSESIQILKRHSNGECFQMHIIVQLNYNYF